jgi:hypothetical protein
MIHVPHVQKAAEWYQSIGFKLVRCNGEGDAMDWAMLSFGEGIVMFSAGGRRSDQDRREVDLYVETEDVDGLFLRLKDRVEIREELHDTEYGMREFIIRDLNRFWITFGEPL